MSLLPPLQGCEPPWGILWKGNQQGSGDCPRAKRLSASHSQRAHSCGRTQTPQGALSFKQSPQLRILWGPDVTGSRPALC